MKPIILILIPLVAILFSSCYYKQRYLIDSNKLQDTAYFQTQKSDFKIQPNDAISIKVISQSKEISDMFSPPPTTQAGILTQEAYVYSGFNVDDSGYVFIPIVGKVFIKDKKINEAQKEIQDKIDQFINSATVIVKFLSFKVTVLGEVNQPGIKYFYNNRVTLLDALAMSGDVKDLGEKRKIKIIRQTMDGVKTFSINATDFNLLKQQSLFLLPNDIVYVEPRKVKSFQLDSGNISIIISFITTSLLFLNYFKLVR